VWAQLQTRLTRAAATGGGRRKKKGQDKRKKQMDEARDYNEGKEIVSVMLQGTQNGSFFDRMPVKKDAVMLVPADYREEELAPSLKPDDLEDMTQEQRIAAHAAAASRGKPFYWGVVQAATKVCGAKQETGGREGLGRCTSRQSAHVSTQLPLPRHSLRPPPHRSLQLPGVG
jgi:hypothetical protein